MCLDVNDLAVSKLVAGRNKDSEFVGALLRHGLVQPEVLVDRLGRTPISEEARARCLARLNRLNR
jgi:hypothetical protein